MNSDTARILVVDDEQDLRALLQRYLTDQHFTVRTASDAAQMSRLLQRENFDVLILDVMLPDEDGMSICRRLRTQGETIPIIMLTARGEVVDRIMGREMGADDYLTKPFNPRELVACIQAQLRRQHMLGRHHQYTNEQVVSFGEFSLHMDDRRLTSAGETIPITSGEFELLKVLVMHAGQPLSRERLLELVQGRGHGNHGRSIDVQILRLRRVIETDPATPRYIQTVWGLGYVFVTDTNSQ